MVVYTPRGGTVYKKGEIVILRDHEDVPYVAIGLKAEVIRYIGGYYIAVIAKDIDGDVIRDGSARHDGVLRVRVESVRRMTPLELLADCAEDITEE